MSQEASTKKNVPSASKAGSSSPQMNSASPNKAPKASGNSNSPSKSGDTPAQQTAEEARQAAQEVGEEVTEQARKAGEVAMQRGKEFAEQRKGIVAEEVGIFSSAIRSAAQSLEEDGQTSVANYAEICADQLESTAKYLRERRLSDLYHDANGFARKHPEIFLGGMFLAGIAAARFLKATRHEPTNESSSSTDYAAVKSPQQKSAGSATK